MRHFGVKIEIENNTLSAERFENAHSALDYIRNKSRSVNDGFAYLYEDGTCVQELIIQDGLAILWA